MLEHLREKGGWTCGGKSDTSGGGRTMTTTRSWCTPIARRRHRPPAADVSLYHRKSNRLFPQVLAHLGSDQRCHAVVLPRTDEQRAYVRTLGLPSLIVPDGAVDGQSAVALADLVVSAGGSMNREAVALGTPVYTTYGGHLGGVDGRSSARGGCGRSPILARSSS